MRVIAKRTLRAFWETHPAAEQALKSLHKEITQSSWNSLNELKADFPSASILKENRVVFNIRGNHYRLVVRLNFELQLCWVRFVGTHSDYDKINANTI